MPLQSGSGWVRFGIPGVVLGAALSSWLGGHGPSALAQGPTMPMPQPAMSSHERPRAVPTMSAEGSGTIALTSPVGNNNAQLLYLIDTKSRAFAVYRIDPAHPKGAVKLEAARQYQWDLKLTEYNNQAPEVGSIESTVKSLGTPSR